jgi:hypothetical protein
MQFSLKSLMILMFIVAVFCTIVLAEVHQALFAEFVWRLVMTLVPAILAIGIIYGQDEQRTFWIGCAASYAAGMWLRPGISSSVISFGPLIFVEMMFQLGVFMVGGLLAVWFRRRLEATRPPVRKPPISRGRTVKWSDDE